MSLGTLSLGIARKVRGRIRNEGHTLFSGQEEMDLLSWGVDLASVEQNISSHRSLHNTVGDYRWQLDKIKADLVP